LAPSPKEIRCYQLLVKKQLEYFRTPQNNNIIEYLVYTLNSPSTALTDISKPSLGYKYTIYDIAKDHELSSCVDVLQGLISKGVLIELGKINGTTLYTTLHGDVVFRVIRGRAYEDYLDGRWVGHYIVEYEESRLPNFNAVKLEKLKELLVMFFDRQGVDHNKSVTAAEAIVEGLEKAGFRSLAVWQYKAIESILLGAEDYYVVDAPTATGKTLVFMIPAIAYALVKKLHYVHRTIAEALNSSSLLVYPRKSLQKQQLEILLKILHHVNDHLSQKLKVELSVAIDKGATEEQEYSEKEIADIDLGNGLHGKLIQVRTKVGDSRYVKLETFLDLGNGQRTSLPYFKGMVLHFQDREYILSQRPDILITNSWTIRERIKSTKSEFQDAYIGRRFIVFDEAHVYININYLDLVAALKLYRNVLFSRVGDRIRFVLSSATIPLRDKRGLVRWVLGLCKDSNCSSYDIDLNKVSLLDYDKLEPDNPSKVLKIIVTLLPYRLSIETLVQGVIQVLAIALMSRHLKAIVFVDSISEVSTLRKYIDTIFHHREGVEICDHILNVSCMNSKGVTISSNLVRSSLDTRPNTYDDYSWSHLAPVAALLNKYVNNLLSTIQRTADTIKEHHGALSDDVRRTVEQGFAKGLYKILLATSTLDLGVNFDDVTFIVQYKEPISDEALIQRVGRAGRKDESFRIAMAFYIPTYTPMLIQALTSKQVASPSSLSSPTILLPHPAIVHRLFNVENLEYDIKRRLFESVVVSGSITLQQLLNAALSNIITILSGKYGVFALLDRKIMKQIRNIIRNVKSVERNVIEKAKSLLNACKPRGAVIGSTSAEIISRYIKDWIKELRNIFDEYAELGVGLALLTPDEAKEQLKMFMQKISEWISKKPQTFFIGNNIAFLLPASEESQLRPAIDLSKIRDVNMCKGSIEAFKNLIDELIRSIESLLEFLQKVNDLRPFIVVLHRRWPRKSTQINVTQNSFEIVWHFEGLREYVLELIRVLIGMVPYYEADSIELSIR